MTDHKQRRIRRRARGRIASVSQLDTATPDDTDNEHENHAPPSWRPGRTAPGVIILLVVLLGLLLGIWVLR